MASHHAAMTTHSAKSLLLLLPEDGVVGPARTERPKIRRYRLVRVRVNPPARGNRVQRGQGLLDSFITGEL